MMINKLLAEVPARIWEEGRPSGERIWDVEFNVAAWIKISGAKGEISLLLCHEDEAGQHGCVVERCTISGDSNNLMSAQVSVRFTGKVRKVQVLLKLSHAEMQMHVDELFVQRKGLRVRPENKLIFRS